MKYSVITFLIIAVVIVALLPSGVTAQGNGSQVRPSITRMPRSSANPSGSLPREKALLKERVQKGVEARTKALEAVIARISENPKLTQAQKEKITAKLTAVVEKFKNNKSQVATQSGEQELQSVVDELNKKNVLSCEIPTAHLTGAQNSLVNAKMRVSELVTKLDTLVTQMEGEGKDVTALKADIAALKVKIAAAQTRLDLAMTTLTQTPSTSSCNATNGRARSELAKAKAEMMQIKRDIAKLKVKFRKPQSTVILSPSPTPIITITTTPTITP